MAEPAVLRAAVRAVVPWRNGAGTTTVVAEGLDLDLMTR